MNRFTIEIRTDNAAFDRDNGGAVELARIVQKVAKSLLGGECTPGDVTPLRDVNGNRVGEVIWESE